MLSLSYPGRYPQSTRKALTHSYTLRGPGHTECQKKFKLEAERKTRLSLINVTERVMEATKINSKILFVESKRNKRSKRSGRTVQKSFNEEFQLQMSFFISFDGHFSIYHIKKINAYTRWNNINYELCIVYYASVRRSSEQHLIWDYRHINCFNFMKNK